MDGLDDIWDQPLATSPPRTAPSERATPARPSPKRRHTTLFFSSDEEGDDAPKGPSTSKSRTPSKLPKDIDALFDDIDDDGLGDVAPALDLDELRRQADARHAKHVPLTPHQVLPSSSPPRDFGDAAAGEKQGEKDDMPEGTKKRKPIARLDEARLLGKDGFPALIKQAKHFKPRGKGHEESDLNRLLQVYQFWSHKMYPKTPFNDSVQRIEKLCHSKRMHNALSVWRDEANGLIHGQRPEDLQSQGSDDSDSDSDKEDDDAAQGHAQASEAEREPRSASRSAPSSPATRPASSASEFTSGAPDDDFDIDAMLREEEESRLTAGNNKSSPSLAAESSTEASIPAARPPPPVDEDEDQAMWDELHDFEETPMPASAPHTSAPVTPQPSRNGGVIDEDEDMWDVVREMEEEQVAQTKIATPPASTAEKPVAVDPGIATSSTSDASNPQTNQPAATNYEDWDDMYL